MKVQASLIIIAVIAITSTMVTAEERYTVKRGDNLSRIGIKYSIPYRDIMTANNLKHTHIYEGQVLVIPTGGPAIPPPPVATVQTPAEPPLPFDRYRSPGVNNSESIPPPEIGVFSGEMPIDPDPPALQRPAVYVKPAAQTPPVYPDSRGRIATPVLPTYNGVSPYNNGGNTVAQAKAPPVAKTPSSYRAKSPVKKISRGRTVAISSRKGTYIVQPGDSVRSISKEFGVTFWDLRSTNNIMFKKIYPGQVLRIPGARTAGSGALRVSPY